MDNIYKTMRMVVLQATLALVEQGDLPTDIPDVVWIKAELGEQPCQR